MCQAKSHGHHGVQPRSSPSCGLGPSPFARAGATGPARTSRREMLRRLKRAGLVAATGGVAWGGLVRAFADDDPSGRGRPRRRANLFDLKRVADGIYAAIARPTAMLNCNAAVVVNRDHVLVVDTHSKPSAARALIRQIRAEVTELPVRYVVDSHLHGDHAMGNEAYPEAFGANVEVISSTKTREWLETLGLPRLRQSLESAAEADRGLPREARGQQGRVRARRTRGAHRGAGGVPEGDDAPAGDPPDDDFRPPARPPPWRPGGPPAVPRPGPHRGRRRRLYPLGARDRDRRPDARPAPLHGGWLPRRVARHAAGARGPGVRPRDPRARLGPGGEVRPGRVPRATSRRSPSG